ncbi:hypothetical protein [Aureimonas sp. ME7]|uniref:hypothetical protein n=1 Tax=Aureimonas sp. ME7 TaxID=2744252 RepID=UPI0015F35607|nr:hypothetical protein [Aureimonas sp. ME7]
MNARGKGERLARVRDVQEKMRQIEEWRLAELVREENRLVENERELLETLGSQSLMHGLFLDAKVSALRRNDMALRETRSREEEARRRVRDAHAAEKRVERAAERAQALEAADRERDELMSALEDHLAAKAASFE